MRDSLANSPIIAQALASRYGGKLGLVYTHAIKGFVVELPDSIAARLAGDTAVLAIEPDRKGGVAGVQYNAPWGLDRIDQRPLPLSGTFGYAYTGAGVRMYIIDSGIRLTHQEFGGRAVTGVDYITPGGTASDCNGHGTHVAGIAGGTTYGVAKSATLISMRVVNCAGRGDASVAIAALDEVVRRKQASPSAPMVANMSVHYGYVPSLNDAVGGAVNAGVAVVAAAANDTADACLDSPSSAPLAIVTAASDASDSFAPFSNRGTCVTLIAPGVDILSAWYTSDAASVSIPGTSMASPFVAGVAASYLEANPTASAYTVRETLKGNATLNAVSGVPAGTPNRLLYSTVASVSLTAPSSASAGPVTATASVYGATGTYYYQWRFKWCYAGTAPHDCDSGSYLDAGGWNMTSLTEQMRDRDKWIEFTVTIMNAPGGQPLSSAVKRVIGPWTTNPPCEPGSVC